MKTLEEISNNLISAIDAYESLPLDDVMTLSEILRIFGVNLSYLVIVRDEYYRKFQNVYYNSKESSNAAKEKEAQIKVPELDHIRKILKHYSDTQMDIRTQISLRKKIDR